MSLQLFSGWVDTMVDVATGSALASVEHTPVLDFSNTSVRL
jgi:hypothetical protein